MADPVYTWLFVRGPETLTVERFALVRVAVSSATGRQVHEFDAPVKLLEFQMNLQSELIQAGWSLEAFHPERRTPQEERAQPYTDATDRRVLASPTARRSRS
jgi:hypothetical protein